MYTSWILILPLSYGETRIVSCHILLGSLILKSVFTVDEEKYGKVEFSYIGVHSISLADPTVVL